MVTEPGLFRLTPVTGQKYETLARRYDWLWKRLVAHAGRPKARLLLFEGSAKSGYRSEHNEIHLVLGWHDLEDVPDAADVQETASCPPVAGWPIWERELHHEFVHEYQDKIIAGRVSDEGRELAGDPTLGGFEGQGHDATYYTAAAEIARALGIDVRAFVSAL